MDALRQIVLAGRRQFWYQQIKENGKPFPIRIVIRKNRAKESICTAERFRRAFELDLIIRFKPRINSCTGIQGRIKFITICTIQI